MASIGEMERHINICVNEIETKFNSTSVTDQNLKQFLKALENEDNEQKRYIFSLGVRHMSSKIKKLIPDHIGKIKFVEGRMSKLIRAFEEGDIYLLPRGELENHLPSYTESPYKITDKSKQAVFRTERDLLLGDGLADEHVRSRYGQLANALDKASRSTLVDMDKYLNYTISDWIHKVQSAVGRGGIKDVESLKNSALVEWSVYSRIMNEPQFLLTDRGFSCTAQLKPIVDKAEREIIFDDETVPSRYSLETGN